mmetsp:Transcript_27704/g.31763  ORF Transcript_27704/g.31763 Transcript_27704/m.31763 type:complete len:165 (+) Transcript_27704:115-609(+)
MYLQFTKLCSTTSVTHEITKQNCVERDDKSVHPEDESGNNSDDSECSIKLFFPMIQNRRIPKVSLKAGDKIQYNNGMGASGCHFNEGTISRIEKSIDLSDNFVSICLFRTLNVINSFCSVKKVETYNVFTKAYDKEDQSDMQDFTEETFECTIGDCSPELYEKN